MAFCLTADGRGAETPPPPAYKLLEVANMDGKKLIEALNLTDWRHGDLVPRSYSGRGMFGKSCVGVTLDGEGSSFQLGAAVSAALLDMDADDGPSDVEDLARLRVCTDSMGRGIIVYWPSVEWPADAEEDEDHDCEGPSCCTPA
jgi:hypothetical protein